MAKTVALLLVLLLAVPVAGATLDSLRADVRKLTGDMEAPNVWADSTLNAFIDRSLGEVGVLGLAYTVWDDIPMTDDSLRYTLTKEPIELQTAYIVNTAGGMNGLSQVNINDYWTQHDDDAYALVDNVVFVTQRVSEENKIIVVYSAYADSVQNLPDAVVPAVTYLAAGDAMISSRTQTGVAMGQAYRQVGMNLIQRWLQARRGKQTDSTAIVR